MGASAPILFFPLRKLKSQNTHFNNLSEQVFNLHRTMIIRASILLLLILQYLAAPAQILPTRPNKTDHQQKKQGEWCLWMDGLWQPTSDSGRVAYYRMITYKNDQPVGITTDFFRSGQKQFEGLILEDKPEDVLEGVCTWYYHTGEVRVVESFKDGEPVGDSKVLLRSGKPADENWFETYKLGIVLYDQQKYAEAATTFVNVIENLEAFSGRETAEYADMADYIAVASSLSEEYTNAIYYEEEYVAVRKLIHQQPDTLMLSTMATLGLHYKLQNNWPRAKSTFKEFLKLNTQYFKGRHPEYPEVIQTFGTVCEALHEYDAALAYLTEAEKIFDTDPEQYEYPILSNIFSLSGLYFSMGEMAKGEQFLSEKIKFIKKNYGVKSDYYVGALGLLAQLHYRSGQLKLAEQEWSEQLNLIKSVSGEKSEGYASTLGSLAELNVLLGDIPKADQYIQQARKIFESADSEEAFYLPFLEKLTAIYSLMGNQTGLIQTTQKRKNLTIKLFGQSSIEYAQVLLAESQLALFDKKLEECITLAKEGISIYLKYEFKVLDDKQYQTIALLHQTFSTSNLMLYYSKFQSDKLKLAHHHAEKSIDLFESRPFQASNVMMNDSYILMGMIYEAELNQQKADQYFDFVLNKVKKEVGENNFQWIDLLFVIARKSEMREDYKKSFTYYQKAIAQQRQYVQHVFPYLSEKEKEQFNERNKGVLQTFYGFAAQYHDQVPGLAEMWCNLLIEQKGIILQSFAPIRNVIFNSSDKSMQQVFNTWQVAKNDYGKLLQNPEAIKSRVDSLAEQLNDLEKKISSYAINTNSKFKPKSTSWKDIQKLLAPDECAIEIVFAVEDRIEGYDSSYYAVIIKPGIEIPIVAKLKTAKEIEGRGIKYYQNAIKQQLDDLISYNTFWKPLEPHLQGIKKVWLSPDGAYHQLNPSTLFNPVTKKYLQEEISIQLVPSTSWILNQKKKVALSKVTIFAHPDYGAVSPKSKAKLTRSLDLETINDLPGTEKELEEITAILNQNKIDFQDYEGAEASEDEIKSLSMPQVLHIATHGFFLPASVDTEQSQNPLLRSGLLMAGCQNKPHLQDPAINDGILTAHEVSTLPLFKTSLVVLSACETGLGDVKNGEGVYGLQRAFLTAGAEQVMMSLWKVDDEATREFMVLFYAGWIELKDTGAAYQHAKKKLMEKYMHPYYWGAFVLSGH